MFVSDTAPYFKNKLLDRLGTLLEVNHFLEVASSPWTNVNVENVMKDIKPVLKSLMVEYRSDLTAWVQFVPMTQWALNSSFSERVKCSPYTALFGGEPTTLLASLIRNQHDVVVVETI